MMRELGPGCWPISIRLRSYYQNGHRRRRRGRPMRPNGAANMSSIPAPKEVFPEDGAPHPPEVGPSAEAVALLFAVSKGPVDGLRVGASLESGFSVVSVLSLIHI